MPKTETANYQLVKELDNTEILSAKFYHQRFSRHVHEGYCIGVIERGAQRFWRSGANHIASQDSIILVNADQVHDGHKATEDGWAYRACYPKPELFLKLNNEFAGQQNTVPWFDDAVRQDQQAAQKLRIMFNLLQNSDQRLARESIFYETLTYLIQRFGKRSIPLAELKSHPTAVRYVMEYLANHFAQSISLSDLAESVNLNPHYLTRLFTRTVGIPPHRFQIQHRIQQAKQMLQQQKSIKDIATDCGFTDQSHLNRHFKFITGTTPGAYQAAC